MSFGNIGLLSGSPHVQEQQPGSYRDGAIGNVEGGEPPGFVVELEEVRDLTEHRSIVDVSERTAHDECEAETRQFRAAEGIALGGPEQNDRNEHEYGNRNNNQQSGPERMIAVGEDTERCSAVLGMNQVEESGNDVDHIPRVHRAFDPQFGNPVEKENRRRNQQRNATLRDNISSTSR
jgi:hypothetical protein